MTIKSINFSSNTIEIIEQYMKDNKVTFNKAVNMLILNNENIITLNQIKNALLKLHKEFKEKIK